MYKQSGSKLNYTFYLIGQKWYGLGMHGSCGLNLSNDSLIQVPGENREGRYSGALKTGRD